jgi:hypothetical protein
LKRSEGSDVDTVDTASVEAPALVQYEAAMAQMLLDAPRPQAIGAAVGFLLHCTSGPDSAALARVLRMPVAGLSPVPVRLADVFQHLADQG